VREGASAQLLVTSKAGRWPNNCARKDGDGHRFSAKNDATAISWSQQPNSEFGLLAQ
jgi:hypothetical protein